MSTQKYCFRCKTELEFETDSDLKKEYPYYCPNCDENMFEFETLTEEDVAEHEQRLRTFCDFLVAKGLTEVK